MRLLITGGSGLLGLKIATFAIEKGYETYSGYNKHMALKGTPIKLDITNRNNVQSVFEMLRPEVVVHAAALTNVDKCEEDMEMARKINIEGTRNIVESSEHHNVFLVYVSTDYVFSGEEGLYRETDETNPINNYGLTKLEAEKNVKSSEVSWCIVRPSVIYGATPAAGKINFALWVLNKLRKREPMNIITDQWVSPTLNTNLAEMILETIDKKLTGIYHLSGATPINRHKFAMLITKKFQLDQTLISPSISKDMNWLAKRPLNTSLNVEKASKKLSKKPLEIDEALNKLYEEITIISGIK